MKTKLSIVRFESLAHHDSQSKAFQGDLLIGQASELTIGQCGEKIKLPNGNEKGHEVFAHIGRAWNGGEK